MFLWMLLYSHVCSKVHINWTQQAFLKMEHVKFGGENEVGRQEEVKGREFGID